MDPAAKAFKKWAAAHVPKRRAATKQDGLDFYLEHRQAPFMHNRDWKDVCVMLFDAGLVTEGEPRARR